MSFPSIRWTKACGVEHRAEAMVGAQIVECINCVYKRQHANITFLISSKSVMCRNSATASTKTPASSSYSSFLPASISVDQILPAALYPVVLSSILIKPRQSVGPAHIALAWPSQP